MKPDDEQREILKRKLEELRTEHRDLDDVIARVTEEAPFDQLRVQRLKKRKLMLKDQITMKLRALGVASLKRSPALPDVPTIAEGGVPDFEAGSWMGLLAPAKTPPKIIAQVSAAAIKTVHAPDVSARLVSLGAEPVGDTPKEFAARIRREHDQNGKIVKAVGVKIE